MRISDWSADVCSSDLLMGPFKNLKTFSIPASQVSSQCKCFQVFRFQRLFLAGFQKLCVRLRPIFMYLHSCINIRNNFLGRSLSESSISHGEFALNFHVLRSEENTSEFQSLMRISYAVFCLKKKI